MAENGAQQPLFPTEKTLLDYNSEMFAQKLSELANMQPPTEGAQPPAPEQTEGIVSAEEYRRIIEEADKHSKSYLDRINLPEEEFEAKWNAQPDPYFDLGGMVPQGNVQAQADEEHPFSKFLLDAETAVKTTDLSEEEKKEVKTNAKLADFVFPYRFDALGDSRKSASYDRIAAELKKGRKSGLWVDGQGRVFRKYVDPKDGSLKIEKIPLYQISSDEKVVKPYEYKPDAMGLKDDKWANPFWDMHAPSGPRFNFTDAARSDNPMGSNGPDVEALGVPMPSFTKGVTSGAQDLLRNIGNVFSNIGNDSSVSAYATQERTDRTFMEDAGAMGNDISLAIGTVGLGTAAGLSPFVLGAGIGGGMALPSELAKYTQEKQSGLATAGKIGVSTALGGLGAKHAGQVLDDAVLGGSTLGRYIATDALVGLGYGAAEGAYYAASDMMTGTGQVDIVGAMRAGLISGAISSGIGIGQNFVGDQIMPYQGLKLGEAPSELTRRLWARIRNIDQDKVTTPSGAQDAGFGTMDYTGGQPTAATAAQGVAPEQATQSNGMGTLTYTSGPLHDFPNGAPEVPGSAAPPEQGVPQQGGPVQSQRQDVTMSQGHAAREQLLYQLDDIGFNRDSKSYENYLKDVVQFKGEKGEEAPSDISPEQWDKIKDIYEFYTGKDIRVATPKEVAEAVHGAYTSKDIAPAVQQEAIMPVRDTYLAGGEDVPKHLKPLADKEVDGFFKALAQNQYEGDAKATANAIIDAYKASGVSVKKPGTRKKLVATAKRLMAEDTSDDILLKLGQFETLKIQQSDQPEKVTKNLYLLNKLRQSSQRRVAGQNQATPEQAVQRAAASGRIASPVVAQPTPPQQNPFAQMRQLSGQLTREAQTPAGQTIPALDGRAVEAPATEVAPVATPEQVGVPPEQGGLELRFEAARAEADPNSAAAEPIPTPAEVQAAAPPPTTTPAPKPRMTVAETVTSGVPESQVGGVPMGGREVQTKAPKPTARNVVGPKEYDPQQEKGFLTTLLEKSFPKLTAAQVTKGQRGKRKLTENEEADINLIKDLLLSGMAISDKAMSKGVNKFLADMGIFANSRYRKLPNGRKGTELVKVVGTKEDPTYITVGHVYKEGKQTHVELDPAYRVHQFIKDVQEKSIPYTIDIPVVKNGQIDPDVMMRIADVAPNLAAHIEAAMKNGKVDAGDYYVQRLDEDSHIPIEDGIRLVPKQREWDDEVTPAATTAQAGLGMVETRAEGGITSEPTQSASKARSFKERNIEADGRVISAFKQDLGVASYSGGVLRVRDVSYEEMAATLSKVADDLTDAQWRKIEEQMTDRGLSASDIADWEIPLRGLTSNTSKLPLMKALANTELLRGKVERLEGTEAGGLMFDGETTPARLMEVVDIMGQKLSPFQERYMKEVVGAEGNRNGFFLPDEAAAKAYFDAQGASQSQNLTGMAALAITAGGIDSIDDDAELFGYSGKKIKHELAWLAPLIGAASRRYGRGGPNAPHKLMGTSALNRNAAIAAIKDPAKRAEMLERQAWYAEKGGKGFEPIILRGKKDALAGKNAGLLKNASTLAGAGNEAAKEVAEAHRSATYLAGIEERKARELFVNEWQKAIPAKERDSALFGAWNLNAAWESIHRIKANHLSREEKRALQQVLQEPEVQMALVGWRPKSEGMAEFIDLSHVRNEADLRKAVREWGASQGLEQNTKNFSNVHKALDIVASLTRFNEIGKAARATQMTVEEANALVPKYRAEVEAITAELDKMKGRRPKEEDARAQYDLRKQDLEARRRKKKNIVDHWDGIATRVAASGERFYMPRFDFNLQKEQHFGRIKVYDAETGDRIVDLRVYDKDDKAVHEKLRNQLQSKGLGDVYDAWMSGAPFPDKYRVDSPIIAPMKPFIPTERRERLKTLVRNGIELGSTLDYTGMTAGKKLEGLNGLIKDLRKFKQDVDDDDIFHDDFASEMEVVDEALTFLEQHKESLLTSGDARQIYKALLDNLVTPPPARAYRRRDIDGWQPDVRDLDGLFNRQFERMVGTASQTLIGGYMSAKIDKQMADMIELGMTGDPYYNWLSSQATVAGSASSNALLPTLDDHMGKLSSLTVRGVLMMGTKTAVGNVALGTTTAIMQAIAGEGRNFGRMLAGVAPQVAQVLSKGHQSDFMKVMKGLYESGYIGGVSIEQFSHARRTQSTKKSRLFDTVAFSVHRYAEVFNRTLSASMATIDGLQAGRSAREVTHMAMQAIDEAQGNFHPFMKTPLERKILGKWGGLGHMALALKSPAIHQLVYLNSLAKRVVVSGVDPSKRLRSAAALSAGVLLGGTLMGLKALPYLGDALNVWETAKGWFGDGDDDSAHADAVLNEEMRIRLRQHMRENGGSIEDADRFVDVFEYGILSEMTGLQLSMDGTLGGLFDAILAGQTTATIKEMDRLAKGETTLAEAASNLSRRLAPFINKFAVNSLSAIEGKRMGKDGVYLEAPYGWDNMFVDTFVAKSLDESKKQRHDFEYKKPLGSPQQQEQFVNSIVGAGVQFSRKGDKELVQGWFKDPQQREAKVKELRDRVFLNYNDEILAVPGNNRGITMNTANGYALKGLSRVLEGQRSILSRWANNGSNVFGDNDESFKSLKQRMETKIKEYYSNFATSSTLAKDYRVSNKYKPLTAQFKVGDTMIKQLTPSQYPLELQGLVYAVGAEIQATARSKRTAMQRDDIRQMILALYSEVNQNSLEIVID